MKKVLLMLAVAVAGGGFAESFKDSAGNTYYCSSTGSGEVVLEKILPRKTSAGTEADLAAVERVIFGKYGESCSYRVGDDFVTLSYAPSAVTGVTVPDDTGSPLADPHLLCRFTACTAYSVAKVQDWRCRFAVINGVLYTEDRSELLAYPAGRTSASYTVDSSAWRIMFAAFKNAAKLTKVTLPAECSQIYDDAFAGSGLKTITEVQASFISSTAFHDTPWWNDRAPGTQVIYDGILLGVSGTCPSVLKVSGTVREITDEAFSECSSLKTVIIPSNVKKIGDYAFSGCHDLTRVEFSEGLEQIGCLVFADTPLADFTIPDSVMGLRMDSFRGSAWWESHVHSSTTMVKNGWLLYVDEDCPAKLTLGSSVKKIATGSVERCWRLKDLTVPASVEYLGLWALDADGLTNMTFQGNCPRTEGSAGYIGFSPEDGVTLRIPAAADGWMMDGDGNALGCRVLQPAGTGLLRMREPDGQELARLYVYPGKVYRLPDSFCDYGSFRFVAAGKRAYDRGALVWNLVDAGKTAFLDIVSTSGGK